MTMSDKIQILNIAIAKIKSQASCYYEYNSQYKSKGDEVKKIAIKALNAIGSTDDIIKAVQNVSFHITHTRPMNTIALFDKQPDSAPESQKAFYDSVMLIVSILEQEKILLENIQHSELRKEDVKQQRTGNCIQIWTLVVSILTLLATIGSIFFTIFVK